MGPVRRTISLMSALALIGVSAWALAWLFLYAAVIKVWMPIMGGICLVGGLSWLWSDFINADPREENNAKGP